MTTRANIAAGCCLGWLLFGCATGEPSTDASRSIPTPIDSEALDITEAAEAAEVAAPALLPVDALSIDVAMRQHVTIQWGGQEESFEAVLQKRGRELLLLGLGPMNTVGFSIGLDDRGVRFDNRTGRKMPFEAERILADVQRVFYPWIDSNSTCVRCDRRGLRGPIEIVERIEAGHLEERRFSIRDRPDRGEIVVRYEDWLGEIEVPGRATLSNAWSGYVLQIETRSAELISHVE